MDLGYLYAVVPAAGTTIEKACEILVNTQKDRRSKCVMEFNGIKVVADGSQTATELREIYQKEVDRIRKEYENSPEGQASRVKAEELRKQAEETAKQGIVEFDVSNQAAWDKWCESNKDGGYGEAILRYAARWAHAMDEKIKDGAKLEDIADSTAQEVDGEGITGFMYGCAVQVLADSWRHGEKLRRWHNKDVQVNDEGDRANESGGVLNPALLTLDINSERDE